MGGVAECLRDAPTRFFWASAASSRSEDQAIIRGIVRDLSLAPDDFIGVDHDLRVALMGGLAGEAGIVLIAGTGSSCYGRDEQGRSWQAGGWGPVLDDPGSSYWLGRQAMIAAVRDHDGRGEPRRLRARVMDALGLIRHSTDTASGRAGRDEAKRNCCSCSNR